MGFGKSAQTLKPTFDLGSAIHTAEVLARRSREVLGDAYDDDQVHYLVHAPGKGGVGKVWYYLDYVTPRSFEAAGKKGSYGPISYITDADPMPTVKYNLSMYRWPDTHRVVLIDTFSSEVRKAANNPKKKSKKSSGYVRDKMRAYSQAKKRGARKNRGSRR